MKNQVELLAHQTLQKLSQQLLASPNAASLTKEEIVQMIAGVIQDDYKSCKKSLKQDFYKKLSRLLHSDRLAGDSQYNELATYLTGKELLDEPQKILNECYTRASPESIFTFFKDVFSKPSLSLDILTRRMPDNPLINNIQRYPDPVKLGVILLLAVSLISFSVIQILSALGSTIARFLINVTNNFITLGLNKITDNRYEQMAELYKAASFPEYKKQFLVESRKKIQAEALDSNFDLYVVISGMDDSELWDYLLNIESINEKAANTSAEEIVNERIKQSTIFTLDKIKSTFFALYAAGTDVNKGVLHRATLLIASPFVLAALAFGEAASLAQGWFFAAVDAANLVSCYVAFTALNVPLISYDVSVSLLEHLMDKDIVDHEVNATKIKKNPLYLLLDTPANTVEQPNSDEEPIHMSSPIIRSPLVIDTDVEVKAEDMLNALLSEGVIPSEAIQYGI
ncbi:MAG: hypothetical protein P4L79_08250 [Legionella sp.]|uniref:hypothetical protein n=1 Tax=Legionella sp. TaxID=459 RepID=UPI002851B260|nr:hypothetical protein [Legionella sp.]